MIRPESQRKRKNGRMYIFLVLYTFQKVHHRSHCLGKTRYLLVACFIFGRVDIQRTTHLYWQTRILATHTGTHEPGTKEFNLKFNTSAGGSVVGWGVLGAALSGGGFALTETFSFPTCAKIHECGTRQPPNKFTRNNTHCQKSSRKLRPAATPKI